MKKIIPLFLLVALCLESGWTIAEEDDNLTNGFGQEEMDALFSAPTLEEIKQSLLYTEAQIQADEPINSVLLSQTQLKKIKQSIKDLLITDFIFQRYDKIEIQSHTDLIYQSHNSYRLSSFPELNSVESTYKSIKISELLFDAFNTQVKSLFTPKVPVPKELQPGGWEPDKPPKPAKPAFSASWDNGAWNPYGSSDIQEPEVEDLTEYPKVWSGPVVNDNVVRYQKKDSKTIARIYFNSTEYNSDFALIMQGIWAVAKQKKIALSASLEANPSADYFSYPLIFRMRLPIHIVTPDGLIPATLITARANNNGECNTGNWLELELNDEQPVAIWALLALPHADFAKLVKIKRENYVPNTFIYDQNYMINSRKVLALSWQNGVLQPLKIIATHYVYNVEHYNDKGKLIKDTTLGSTWGSKVFLDKKTVKQEKGYENKTGREIMVNNTYYGPEIHRGDFGDCPTN